MRTSRRRHPNRRYFNATVLASLYLVVVIGLAVIERQLECLLAKTRDTEVPAER